MKYGFVLEEGYRVTYVEIIAEDKNMYRLRKTYSNWESTGWRNKQDVFKTQEEAIKYREENYHKRFR